MTGSRAAVLGKPVAHSLSPLLHRAAYEALGLKDWVFERHEVDTDELAAFVSSLDGHWRGLALTMPLKECALQLADVTSELARRTGAANTLVREAGSWRADNTDVWGVRAALTQAGAAIGAGDGAVVLGSGATARSALAAIDEMGIEEVVLAVRDLARPETLQQARDAGIAIRVVPLEQVAPIILDAVVTVSTLPPGGADGVAAALGGSVGAGRGKLLDVVYAGWPTPLARAGERVGMTVVPGIEMLIHQAAEQVRLMTGHDAPLAAMQAAGRAAHALRAS